MIKIILLSIALVVASAAPATAHLRCWPTAVLWTYLVKVYQEARVMTAIGRSGYPVELWRSKDGETFSIVTYRPPSQACLIATGVDAIEIEWILPLGEPA